mmetsp:Transcript_15677/g.48573  ORF Transcript_15677/g.48573 Transcript_15677/m.48573 type:complete len:212 (-) Transcript_15677:334-969(-)
MTRTDATTATMAATITTATIKPTTTPTEMPEDPSSADFALLSSVSVVVRSESDNRGTDERLHASTMSSPWSQLWLDACVQRSRDDSDPEHARRAIHMLCDVAPRSAVSAVRYATVAVDIPSDRHATRASADPNKSSHTVPQIAALFGRTSRRPEVPPPASRAWYVPMKGAELELHVMYTSLWWLHVGHGGYKVRGHSASVRCLRVQPTLLM